MTAPSRSASAAAWNLEVSSSVHRSCSGLTCLGRLTRRHGLMLMIRSSIASSQARWNATSVSWTLLGESPVPGRPAPLAARGQHPVHELVHVRAGHRLEPAIAQALADSPQGMTNDRARSVLEVAAVGGLPPVEVAADGDLVRCSEPVLVHLADNPRVLRLRVFLGVERAVDLHSLARGVPAYAAGAYFDRHLAQDVHDKAEDRGDNEVDRWLEAMTGATPPPSRSEADDTAKVRSVLGGMAEALFKKYSDDEYQPPENI
jgi:hypothetical protein